MDSNPGLLGWEVAAACPKHHPTCHLHRVGHSWELSPPCHPLSPPQAILSMLQDMNFINNYKMDRQTLTRWVSIPVLVPIPHLWDL